MQLSPTARVILGVLGLGPRTGYDIKKLTDVSTRFFWSASYGQIYPELKRLEAAGLVEATPEPTGRSAAHRVRAHPGRGVRVYRHWLRDDSSLSLRDPRRGNAEALFR